MVFFNNCDKENVIVSVNEIISGLSSLLQEIGDLDTKIDELENKNE